MRADNKHPHAALALLGLFVLGVIALAVAPHVWSQRLAVQEARALHDLAAAQQRVAAIVSPSAGNTTDADASVATAHLLTGETSGIAAARLQARLNAIAGVHGGTIDVTRVLPAQPDGDLTRVAIAASLRTTIKGLQSILYGLESGQPFLILERIVVNRPARRSGRLHISETKDDRDLIVELQFAGFSRFREENAQ